MQALTLFLCGDVMTGRGIDQILTHPSAPQLYEPYVRSAVDYVQLAEDRNGPITRPAPPAYPWGDALAELSARAPDVRVINLETAVTTSDDAWPGKGIHYRMHPDNLDCLRTAGVDCAVLANNHVLDWGRAGLAETLVTLDKAGIAHAGAGLDAVQAGQPAVLPLAGGGRVLVLACAMENAGAPAAWKATENRSGVQLRQAWSDAADEHIAEQVGSVRQPGDRVVFSIHWGSNWGYAIAPGRRAFARALVELAGVDIVHGHSSHHPLGIECHAGKPILYGCGDFINDYEGIGGYEEYQPDLAVMFFARFGGGDDAELTLVPLRRERFRLRYPDEHDIARLIAVLNREGRALGTVAERTGMCEMRVRAA
jgi:poly-gamma-glutamate synthesis protein (capsule biosynthesis protein)